MATSPYAPWTAAEMARLRSMQRHPGFHPLTCPNRTDSPHRETLGDLGVLLVSTEHLYCPDCAYVQTSLPKGWA